MNWTPHASVRPTAHGGRHRPSLPPSGTHARPNLYPGHGSRTASLETPQRLPSALAIPAWKRSALRLRSRAWKPPLYPPCLARRGSSNLPSMPALGSRKGHPSLRTPLSARAASAARVRRRLEPSRARCQLQGSVDVPPFWLFRWRPHHLALNRRQRGGSLASLRRLQASPSPDSPGQSAGRPSHCVPRVPLTGFRRPRGSAGQPSPLHPHARQAERTTLGRRLSRTCPAKPCAWLDLPAAPRHSGPSAQTRRLRLLQLQPRQRSCPSLRRPRLMMGSRRSSGRPRLLHPRSCSQRPGHGSALRLLLVCAPSRAQPLRRCRPGRRSPLRQPSLVPLSSLPRPPPSTPVRCSGAPASRGVRAPAKAPLPQLPVQLRGLRPLTPALLSRSRRRVLQGSRPRFPAEPPPQAPRPRP